MEPMLASWQPGHGAGASSEEYALAFDQQRAGRLLVLPPLFDEHNKLRRQLVLVMRRLDGLGIDSVLPDLPGQNESLADLALQTLDGWREAVRDAVARFCATHVLAVRSGALLVPATAAAFLYAPHDGPAVLRAMTRARALALREAGHDESAQAILDRALREGAELSGWQLSAAMVGQLQRASCQPSATQQVIDHAAIGGRPLWLRAEPDEDRAQAEALGDLVAAGIERA